MKSEKGTNVVSLLSIMGKILTTTMTIAPDYQTQNHIATSEKIQKIYTKKSQKAKKKVKGKPSCQFPKMESQVFLLQKEK